MKRSARVPLLAGCEVGCEPLPMDESSRAADVALAVHCKSLARSGEVRVAAGEDDHGRLYPSFHLLTTYAQGCPLAATVIDASDNDELRTRVSELIASHLTQSSNTSRTQHLEVSAGADTRRRVRGSARARPELGAGVKEPVGPPFGQP